jgi:TetR/AcrR family transcriptional regulator, cholesterol catabolism regulator
MAPNAPKKTTRKSMVRRNQILQSAIVLFDQRGYSSTSLDDIAKDVGFTREGVYYYFKNRSEILYEIIEPQSASLLFGLKEIVEDDALSYEEKLRGAVRNHLARFDRYCLEMTVCLRDGLVDVDSDVRKKMMLFWKHYEAMWCDLIKAGQHEGSFREIGDPKLLAFGILGMCNWMARWYDQGGPFTVEKIIECFSELTIGGIKSP